MDDEIVSPYMRFTKNGDPEPMIAWLEKALNFVSEDTTDDNQEHNTDE